MKLNARRVPIGSVLLGALAGFLGIIAATEAPDIVFNFLVASSGALIVFVYTAIIVAQIRLRLQREQRGEPKPAVSMWLFPWLSYLAIGRDACGTHRHGMYAVDAARFLHQLSDLGGSNRGIYGGARLRRPAPAGNARIS